VNVEAIARGRELRADPITVPTIEEMAAARFRAEMAAGKAAFRARHEEELAIARAEREARRARMRQDGISIGLICASLSEYYGISEIELRSRRRLPRTTRAKQVGYYLARKMTVYSTPMIGRRFGGRDHTTILYGVRKITDQLKTDAALRAEVEAVRLLIEPVVCHE
jgi:chromosomal replication initiator protein